MDTRGQPPYGDCIAFPYRSAQMRAIARRFVLARRSKLPALALAAAFMPSLLFLGHWGPMAAHDHTHASAPADPVTEHQHEAHCHAGLASCAEQPPPSTFAVFDDAIRPEIALGTERAVPVASERVPQSHSTKPPTPPPNGAL